MSNHNRWISPVKRPLTYHNELQCIDFEKRIDKLNPHEPIPGKALRLRDQKNRAKHGTQRTRASHKRHISFSRIYSLWFMYFAKSTELILGKSGISGIFGSLLLKIG